MHSPGHVAATDEQAREQLWPHFKATPRPDRRRARLAARSTAAEFDHEAGPDGSLYVGSPETVARKIAHTVRTLGLDRFDLKYSNGPLPHEQSMRASSCTARR